MYFPVTNFSVRGRLGGRRICQNVSIDKVCERNFSFGSTFANAVGKACKQMRFLRHDAASKVDQQESYLL